MIRGRSKERNVEGAAVDWGVSVYGFRSIGQRKLKEESRFHQT